MSTDGEAVLALERSILMDVAKEIGVEFECADDAVKSFVLAVRDYQSRGRPWRVEAAKGKRPPRFLILIAVQVFAASQMDDADGEYTKQAYYIQLAKLVGDHAMGANFAADHGEEHRALWDYLIAWLAKHNRTIRLPSDAKGTKDRNVGLPKSQALLRRADLAQLPVFFRNCGYRPGANVSEDKLVNDVQIRKSDPTYFPSNWARRVLEDKNRFPTAVRQIFNELQKWDGEWELANAGSSIRENQSKTKFWFGISRKRSLLVSKGGRSLETSRSISVDDLQNLLSGKKDANGNRLNLIDGINLGRFDADDCMYQPVSGFEPGDRGLIATDTRNSTSDDLLDRLMECENVATNIQYYAKEEDFVGDFTPLTGIPEACLFATFDISDPLPHPYWVDPAWHRFLKTPRPKLVPVGGLRFGRKKNWVEGAGPSIRIAGASLPKTITIDGQIVRVDQRIIHHDLLSESGDHIVSATIDGIACSPCRVLVSRPSEPATVIQYENRWRFTAGRAPAWERSEEYDTCLLGAHYRRGKTENHPNEAMSPTEERQAAIKALASFPIASAVKALEGIRHPLTKWLVERSNIQRQNQRLLQQ